MSAKMTDESFLLERNILIEHGIVNGNCTCYIVRASYLSVRL